MSACSAERWATSKETWAPPTADALTTRSAGATTSATTTRTSSPSCPRVSPTWCSTWRFTGSIRAPVSRPPTRRRHMPAPTTTARQAEAPPIPRRSSEGGLVAGGPGYLRDHPASEEKPSARQHVLLAQETGGRPAHHYRVPSRSIRDEPPALLDKGFGSRQGAHRVRRASVGERRAARIAGIRPAMAPIA